MKIHLFHIAPSGASHKETVLEVVPYALLSEAIWLSGHVTPVPLCAGMGRCGRCRVRFALHAPPPLSAEEEILSQDELALGWRLACRRQIFDGGAPMYLEIPQNPEFPQGCDTSDQMARPVAGNGMAKNVPLVLAVDLGTTSVQWRALAAVGNYGKKPEAAGSFLNPQAGAGADVMSRLAFAARPGGRRLLSGLVRTLLRNVATRLGGRVERVCLAANTAMTDIFLDRDVSGLCAAPYRTSHNGHEFAGLPDLPPVYIPPLPAPFVGGDAAAALLAALYAETPRPFVLTDMGTNAEMTLVTACGAVFMTSVPLGPALEGIGMECGRLAGPAAATRFSLTPAGLAAHTSGGSARGISATGYISLIALLRRSGLLDAAGRFVAPEACAMPLMRRIAAGLEWLGGRPRLLLLSGDSLWLSAGDVEEVLKVRAAFALALEKLLAAGGLAARDVACLCLAGALGEYVDPADLATLGFTPQGLPVGAVKAVGNAALDGAALLALRPERGETLARICRKARQIFLAKDAVFQQEYLQRIGF